MATVGEAAIRRVIAATTEMFNRHDAKGFVQYYTPDVDLVTVRGEVMKGTAEIEAGLNRIFLTRAGNATLVEVDASIRLLGPDVALANVTNELSGLVGPAGEHLPAHRERSIRVFVKKDGAWKVSCSARRIRADCSQSQLHLESAREKKDHEGARGTGTW